MALTATVTKMSSADDDRVAGLRILDRGTLILFDDLFVGTHQITLGRGRDNDIVIRDKTISRSHCVLRRLSDGCYLIQDDGSHNGVKVAPVGGYSEYRNVDECELHLGMHIRLGNFTLTPVNASGEAPIIAMDSTEYLIALLRLYGSLREIENHVKANRKTLARRLADKLGIRTDKHKGDKK